jgi:hypothetical protein
MTGTDTSLVGREAELSRLRELVAPPYAESRVLLLLGGPGMGKQSLLSAGAGDCSHVVDTARAGSAVRIGLSVCGGLATRSSLPPGYGPATERQANRKVFT